MANQPSQLPNIDLPGAEYFSIAPNRTVALQGRRRVFLQPTATSIPAASSAPIQGQQLLETGFVGGAGIFLHDARLILFPQDTSGQLQIISSLLGLTVNSSAGIANGYWLGIPALTQLSPGGGVVALADQEKLIAQRDIAALSFGAANTTNLFLQFQVFLKNNDGTNPHSMQPLIFIIYTRLDGLLE